jgi:hypothetical protein
VQSSIIVSTISKGKFHADIGFRRFDADGRAGIRAAASYGCPQSPMVRLLF